ncbi:MAG: hypothetical protein V2B18_24930 [Pseudomonadota bacterium]
MTKNRDSTPVPVTGAQEHAIAPDLAIRRTKTDDRRGNKFKKREVRNAVRKDVKDGDPTNRILGLVRNQGEY